MGAGVDANKKIIRDIKRREREQERRKGGKKEELKTYKGQQDTRHPPTHRQNSPEPVLEWQHH